ncbi:MAG TPA: SAM-dependent methyltransferase [Methylophilaceae bacterium]|nr:SAM-dependent methyltransferase [Methylophilaceae bacterium]
MKCRHCKINISIDLCNLGFAPVSNGYLTKSQLSRKETYYPLRVGVCEACWLVQTEDFSSPEELFASDYAYFSSASSSFLAHAKSYVEMIVEKLALNSTSLVCEIASNDGYLLKNFHEKEIPCFGIEPTLSTAEASEALGIENIKEFFGTSLAEKLSNDGRQCDLILGNNVFAHVPDINDFTIGLKTMLKIDGVVTLEFPHLVRLLASSQFDTIYHEHYSYLSLHAVNKIFQQSGLRLFHVEEIETHGGSLRVYGCRADSFRLEDPSVKAILLDELTFGICRAETYEGFQAKIINIKKSLLEFLLTQQANNKKVVGYGAAAKGNTLLNYSGIKPDLISYVFDGAQSKQNKFLPGSHIPILEPSKITAVNPDFVIIFPWNIANEIQAIARPLVSPETKFLVAIPELKIL